MEAKRSLQLVVPPPQRGTMAAGLGRSLSEAAAEGGEDRKRKQSQKKGFLGFFLHRHKRSCWQISVHWDDVGPGFLPLLPPGSSQPLRHGRRSVSSSLAAPSSAAGQRLPADGAAGAPQQAPALGLPPPQAVRRPTRPGAVLVSVSIPHSWCPLLPSPLGDLSLWSHPDPANPPATASLVRQELAFRSTPCLIFEFKLPSPRNAGRGTHKLTGSPPVLPASKEDPTLQVTHQCWQTAKRSSYWK